MKHVFKIKQRLCNGRMINIGYKQTNKLQRLICGLQQKYHCQGSDDANARDLYEMLKAFKFRQQYQTERQSEK